VIFAGWGLDYLAKKKEIKTIEKDIVSPEAKC
jgi:hypothetical protein